jgi:hypothetical protein
VSEIVDGMENFVVDENLVEVVNGISDEDVFGNGISEVVNGIFDVVSGP